MQIEEGKFYFIKDDFFELFSNYDLMTNKENGIKRPCYLCFKDNIDEDIIWFIPISHKVEKYRAIYEKKRKKRKTVYNFVFGEVLGKEKVFLIQNMFPVTKEYIVNKYKVRGEDVSISDDLKEYIIQTAVNALFFERKYKGMILFADVYKMKEILLKEKINV